MSRIRPIPPLVSSYMPLQVRRNLPILREVPAQKMSREEGPEIALTRFRTGSGNDC
jgi:hypothetical protein